ncbi:MAG: MotA/TolQ/ExbB proton channel family protein [Thermoguttaceae bacterium]
MHRPVDWRAAAFLAVFAVIVAGPAMRLASSWAADSPARAADGASEPTANKAADKAGAPAAADKATGKDSPTASNRSATPDDAPSAKKPAKTPPAPAKKGASPADDGARVKTPLETAEKSAEKTPEPQKEEKFLVWLYRSMGFNYAIIFMTVTFNEVALVVMIVLGLRRSRICPPDLIAEFDSRLKKKQYQDAYDLAKKSNSFVGKVLASGMSNLSEGYDAALEAMQETGEEQTMRLEQRNGNIALVAQIGPMLGLLATVDGIVRAFGTIATKDTTPKPSELAAGIGIALVNTMVGLWLAVPSIVFYHYARNRLTRLIYEAGTISSRLMKRFAKLPVTVTKS